MEDIFSKEENAKNIYVIKRKLSELRRVPAQVYYEYEVGSFVVRMYVRNPSEPEYYRPLDLSNMNESLTSFDKMDVDLYQKVRDQGSDGQEWTRLEGIILQVDPRFKDYEPIRYDVFEHEYGTVNLSNGKQMPLIKVCELIRYLHRLSNLAAFL